VSEVNIFTPAKLNLTLEVLGKRSDGFHEIRSVMQAVSLGDALSFSHSEALSFECDMDGWSSEKSLVSQAAELLRKESSYPGGALVKITKCIPLSSGLGGDASDAAAVLRGLRALWRIQVSQEELSKLAARLGSDVPFFIGGGTAVTRGRGEVVAPLSAAPKQWFVILTPDIPRPNKKTAAVYARLRTPDYTSGEYSEALAGQLIRGGGISDRLLYNVFERVAFDLFPGLTESREAMLAAGAERVHLAGAGPSLYSLHKSRAEAESVCSGLAGQPAYVAEALGPIKPEEA